MKRTYIIIQSVFLITCLMSVKAEHIDNDEDIFSYGSSYLKQSVNRTDFIKMNQSEIEIRNEIEHNPPASYINEINKNLKGPRAGNDPKEVSVQTEELIYDQDRDTQEGNSENNLPLNDIPEQIMKFMNDRPNEVLDYEVVYSESLYKLFWVEKNDYNLPHAILYLKMFDDTFESCYKEERIDGCGNDIIIKKFTNGNFLCLWTTENDIGKEAYKQYAMQVFNALGGEVGKKHLLEKSGFYGKSIEIELNDAGDRVIIISSFRGLMSGSCSIINIMSIDENGESFHNEADISGKGYPEIYDIHKMPNGHTAILYGVNPQPQCGQRHADVAVQLVDGNGCMYGDKLLLEGTPERVYGSSCHVKIIDRLNIDNLPNGDVVITWANTVDDKYRLRIIGEDGKYIGAIRDLSYYNHVPDKSLSNLNRWTNSMIRILPDGNIAYFRFVRNNITGAGHLAMGLIGQDGEIIAGPMDREICDESFNIAIYKTYELKNGNIAVLWYKRDFSDSTNDKIYIQIFDKYGEHRGGVLELSGGMHPVFNPNVMGSTVLEDNGIIVFLNGYQKKNGDMVKYSVISSKGNILSENILTPYHVILGDMKSELPIYRFTNGNFVFAWREMIYDREIGGLYKRLSYQVFNKDGIGLTEIRALRRYDCWDGAITGDMMQLLPSGDMALLWIERHDVNGNFLAGRQSGSKRDGEYYYSLFLRFMDNGGAFVSEEIKLDQREKIWNISLENLTLHNDIALEVFWRQEDNHDDLKLLRKTTLDYNGEVYNINAGDINKDQDKDIYTVSTEPIISYRSENRNNLTTPLSYFLWGLRPNTSRIDIIRMGLPGEYFGMHDDQEYLSDRKLSVQDIYMDKLLIINKIGHSERMSKIKNSLDVSINGNIYAQRALQQALPRYQDIIKLINSLKTLANKGQIYSAALETSLIILCESSIFDDNTLDDFENIVSLFMAEDSIKNMLGDADFMVIRAAFTNMNIEIKKLYNDHINHTKHVYEKLMNLLCLDIDGKIGETMMSVNSMDITLKKKLLVDFKIRELSSKQHGQLNDNEIEAVNIYNNEILPIRKLYSTALNKLVKGLISRITAALKQGSPYALREDSDSTNAMLLLDESVINGAMTN